MSLKRGFEGMLFCWGCGELGQDGHRGTAVVKSEDGLLDAFTPQKLGRVKLFACGSSHSVVITVDNRIFAWGNGSSGQLGSGERSMKTYPVEAFLPSNRDDDVTGIEVAGVACGSRHTFIWTQSGHAYSFGNNFYAQLGYDFRKVDFKEHQLMPCLLRTLVFHRVKQVACGEHHTLFALEDGKVAACGINDYGQIGTDAQEDATVPRILEAFDNVSKIACGANHNLAVTGDGKVFMWGCGRACGNLKRDLRLPEQVDIPHSRVIAVSGGCWHSLLLTDDGNMYSWGTGQEGQLGHGETTTFLSKPQLLCSELLKGAIRKIDAGDCYSSALTANGELFMWGRNCHVIDGNQPASHKFWSLQKADVSNQAVCDISCGSWHTMILTGIPKGRSPGNKESDFRETGASFKDDSNYPQLIELLPKENSSRKHTGDLQAPPNQAEVLLHSQSSQPSSQPKNSPFDGMDQTDLNRKNHSDGTTVQDASALSAKEKQGNSCSSIKLQEENVRVLIPRGKRFRNRQAFSCLRSPLIPDCLCSGDADYPNTLPEMRRKPKCRSRPQTAGSPWTSSRQPGNGDSSSSTNFSKASHQSGRIPGRELGCALHPRVRPEGQESGPRHGSRPRMAHPHLSPLASHSTASSSLIVTLNPSERLAGRPVYQQAIYSSGTAWKHISRLPDPVLSQKRPASETIQQSS